MRIPRDGSTFRDIEERWPIFKEDTRNVIISLVVDGVNPFGEIKTNHLVWLVFIMNN